MRVIAVTGTDGKTSTVTFTRQLLVANGLRASSYGSDGWRGWDGFVGRPPGFIGAYALPDQLVVERALGTDAIIIEAFSSGLATGIYDHVTVDAAAFTNLRHDHFDRHVDRSGYLSAKRRLFDHVLRSEGTAVLRRGTALGRHLADVVASRGGHILEVGRSIAAAIRLHRFELTTEGTRLHLQIGRHRATCIAPVVGHGMIESVLLALGLARNAGLDPSDLMTALPLLKPPPGRLEPIGMHSGATVVLDNAHTPGAIAASLISLRPRCKRRLHIVLGCGGCRDSLKRPMMARVVTKLADIVTVTDDNPRREDPATLRAALLAGCPTAHEVPDRAEAIVHAMKRLRSGDVLLLAGRGDETHQERADGFRELSDRTVAQAEMSQGPTLCHHPLLSAHTLLPPIHA